MKAEKAAAAGDTWRAVMAHAWWKAAADKAAETTDAWHTAADRAVQAAAAEKAANKVAEMADLSEKACRDKGDVTWQGRHLAMHAMTARSANQEAVEKKAIAAEALGAALAAAEAEAEAVADAEEHVDILRAQAAASRSRSRSRSRSWPRRRL